MGNRDMDKTLQHGDWTTNNNLTTHAHNYGAFNAYVIRYVKTVADQGPMWTGDVPEYLKRPDTQTSEHMPRLPGHSRPGASKPPEYAGR